jgi:predicted RNase H-like HicB family nuclease
MPHEREYTIILEQAGSGANWGAYSPDVSGCIAVDDAPESTLTRFTEALEFHFESLRQEGLPIPEPSVIVRTIR